MAPDTFFQKSQLLVLYIRRVQRMFSFVNNQTSEKCFAKMKMKHFWRNSLENFNTVRSLKFDASKPL